MAYAQKYNLKITSVDEVIKYRVANEVLVRCAAVSDQTTRFGVFKTHVFKDDADGKEHLALVFGDVCSTAERGLLVRVHSECLTGDVFGSRRCDCGEQLNISMQRVVEEGAGIILYLRQEGRGIGLANKVRAYALQDLGHDTVEANLQLGFSADSRDFAVAARILQHFGVQRVRLMTNNPNKLETLKTFGIEIVERLSVIAAHDPYSTAYLEAKRSKLGHLL